MAAEAPSSELGTILKVERGKGRGWLGVVAALGAHQAAHGANRGGLLAGGDPVEEGGAAGAAPAPGDGAQHRGHVRLRRQMARWEVRMTMRLVKAKEQNDLWPPMKANRMPPMIAPQNC